MSENSRAPDFGKIFERLRNPSLLCYYFFFPAHEESLAPPCDVHVYSKEFAGFAGEWACMAVLLERDNPSMQYSPTWIGHTGRRLPDVEVSPGVSVPWPQAFDPERRSNMKVHRWRPGTGAQALLPELLGEQYPKLFVSRWTHSLHLLPGQHAVDPYPADIHPQWCGEFDTPHALDEYKKSHPPAEPKYFSAFVAKTFGGNLFGPLGFVAGMVWALLKGNAPGYGITPAVALGDQPTPDTGPEPGDLGKVVHPTTVTISDAGAQPQPWVANQNVPVGTRRYDLLVDRAIQVWWPSDDGSSGFRGRWGPRVEGDPVGRRAGMRFPPFWRMFFEAFAKATKGPWSG